MNYGSSGEREVDRMRTLCVCVLALQGSCTMCESKNMLTHIG